MSAFARRATTAQCATARGGRKSARAMTTSCATSHASRAAACAVVVTPNARWTRARATARRGRAIGAIEDPSEVFKEEDLDNIVFVDLANEEAAISNKSGAGATMAAPDWMTQLNRLWGGASEIPVADAKLEDITGLLGGGLFQPLFKWMRESGPVYLLPTGPITSYVVVSDPDCIKQVLFNYGSRYIKGTIAEAGEFLFGLGVALQELEPWKIRRKAVAPSLHRKYVEAMVDRCFGPCADRMVSILEGEAGAGGVGGVNMESRFSMTSLSTIGISVFKISCEALTTAAPVIQATYTALKEVETRSMDLLPTWRLPEKFLRVVSPRQRDAQDAVTVIRDVTQRLVDDCKRMVEEEEEKVGGAEEWARDYLNESNPSVLRYLIAAREEVSSTQLRDDLLSLLVAGHETTASVLTWGTYELLKPENAEQLRLLRAELDEVLGTRPFPTFADLPKMPYLERCFHESMRLYPQPPVYTRRAVVEDVLPNGMTIPKNQDLLVSIYNLHRSPTSWGPTSQEFEPMRFGPLANGQPNELNTDYRYVPFSAGPRRCPGDKFAVYEGIVIWATMFRRLDLELKAGHDVVMTSGATIHTKSGLLATVKARAMREVAEADRVDWANLKPAKDIGEEWMEKALFNSEATGAVSAGKCPMGH